MNESILFIRVLSEYDKGVEMYNSRENKARLGDQQGDHRNLVLAGPCMF